VDVAHARPDGRESQRRVDHGQPAADQQDAGDVLVGAGAEAPGIVDAEHRVGDGRQLRQRRRRRIAEREHHLVGVLRAAIVEPQFPACIGSAPQLQDAGAMVLRDPVGRRAGAGFLESCAQVFAVQLARQIVRGAGGHPLRAGEVEEVRRVRGVQRHLPRGDVQWIGIVTRRVGHAGAELGTRLVDHDAQRRARGLAQQVNGHADAAEAAADDGDDTRRA
jgi:hypothetical protein